MSDDSDLDRVLWRLAQTAATGRPPQLTVGQLTVLLDRLMPITAITPVRLGGQRAWSVRRDSHPPLTPGEVLGLCLDARDHRFAVNLKREWALGIVGELRRGGIGVGAHDQAQVRSTTRPMP